MRIYIKGCDSIEIMRVTGKNQSKHFIKTAAQLYKIYPDGLHRCYIERRYFVIFAKQKETDEMNVFDENARYPHYPVPGVAYDQESVLRDIDEHKITGYGGRLRFKPYIKAAGDIWKVLATGGGVLLSGIIILWAVIF